ncbi:MAG: bifunctional diaminohydroxyphosphoribosylaminopyrimidine deaminase/5-amino-6-(5-phosphoribosylamino)uracil reductase RibD [Beijerinckiaceae bacterium]
MTQWTAQPFVDPALDQRFMAEALDLGRANLGRTWPNPSVGAVVVKDGVVVGRGATQPGGRPHAEAVALAEAGLKAVGATLYVTLEPCSHRSVRGGTPCLEHTLLAGIRRVVSAMDDPNPHIAGVSHALLRSAGVKVTIGSGAEQAIRDNLGHILRVREARPMVTLKLAQTADGYCAPEGGGRLQVSGDEAMREVHLLRASHDVIMVGAGTVLSDDPLLNVRLPGLEEQSPVRVVLDSQLRLPLTSRLVATAQTIPVWVVASEHAPVENEKRLRATGIEVMRVGCADDGHVDLAAALKLLALRGVTRVFSEGGPQVGEALVRAGLADVVIVSTADHALGAPGIVALRPAFAGALRDAGRFTLRETARHGTDVFTTYERAA